MGRSRSRCGWWMGEPIERLLACRPLQLVVARPFVRHDLRALQRGNERRNRRQKLPVAGFEEEVHEPAHGASGAMYRREPAPDTEHESRPPGGAGVTDAPTRTAFTPRTV